MSAATSYVPQRQNSGSSNRSPLDKRLLLNRNRCSKGVITFSSGNHGQAVAYAALNRLMLEARDPRLGAEIRETWEGKRNNLPLWADSAWSVHAYEGKADDEPAPSRYVGENPP